MTAVITFFNSYLIIHSSGSSVYGAISLVSNLFQLIIFADLGIGAAVISTLADAEHQPRGSARAIVDRILRWSVKRLWVTALLISALSWAIGVAGMWTNILGLKGLDSSTAATNLSVAITISIFAVSIPFGLSQRVLLAVRRNDTLTAISAVIPVVSLLWTALVLSTDIDVIYLSAGPTLGILCASVLWTFAASRFAELHPMFPIQLASPKASYRERDRAYSRRLWGIAGPQLVIIVVAPIAVQSDRLVLAHFGSLRQVAEYSLASQFYTPTLSVLTTATLSLWPAYRRDPSRARSLWRRGNHLALGFGLVTGALYALLAGPIGTWLSGGEIRVDYVTSIAFGLLIGITVLLQVSANALTDASGFRFQMATALVMLVVNVPLSIWLTIFLGTAGPILGTAVSVCVVQLLPTYIRARRLLSAPRYQSIPPLTADAPERTNSHG